MIACCTLYLEVALHQIPPLMSVLVFLDHVAPSHCWISALHLLFSLPLDLFPSLTCHSVHLTVHRLSFIRATCPAHFHFSLVISSRISFIFVLCLISKFGTLSMSFIPSIFLSIMRWHISIFWVISFVSVQVWHPYVRDGNMDWLKTCLFRFIGMSLFSNISLYFPKTNHPAFIFSCVSLT